LTFNPDLETRLLQKTRFLQKPGFKSIKEGGSMSIRGVRGATVASRDDSEAILSATRQLLQALVKANPPLQVEELASAWFTVTSDLTAVHPAKAARQLGWEQVPLMCALEIPVPESLPRCIRVLLHWNTDLAQSEIRHVYLGAAANLRPDLTPDVLNKPR
jgi:chorismate mutase